MTQVARGNHQAASLTGHIHRIQYQVIADMAALAPMRDEWDELVAASGGDVYFTYDWCRIWWQYYRQDRQLRVLLCRQDDRLVGILPLIVDRLWLGPVPMRLAKLLGSDSTTVVLNPPVLPEFAIQIYEHALRYILDAENCDALWLGPLAGTRPHREQIRSACASASDMAHVVQDEDQTVHTVFPLPDTYDGYLASLEKDHRAMVRRERKIFEKECQPVIDIVEDPGRIGAAFDEFVKLHQIQWTAQNKLGHFGDMPQSEAFNRDLVTTLGERGRAWMLRITSNGQLIACEYVFVFAGGLYWRLPARQVGDKWERLSLGRVSLAYLIEKAIQRQIRWIEGGAGEYPYKRRMGAREFTVGSMLIAASRRSSRWKTGVFCRLSHVLHLLYYRIWFSRVGPALPLKRRPLWRIWIRSRI